MMRKFINMNFLKNNTINNYTLEHFTIIKDSFYTLINKIPPGEYVRLINKYDCIMSNTPMELQTNQDFINNAYGDVLIARLVIGLIVLPIQNYCNSITIIEKSNDIIDLIVPQLPLNDNVTIINEDIFKFIPKNKYDCIYFDIWNYVNSDIYKEMVKLKNKFKPFLKDKNGYIKCWAEYQAKNNLRLT